MSTGGGRLKSKQSKDNAGVQQQQHQQHALPVSDNNANIAGGSIAVERQRHRIRSRSRSRGRRTPERQRRNYTRHSRSRSPMEHQRRRRFNSRSRTPVEQQHRRRYSRSRSPSNGQRQHRNNGRHIGWRDYGRSRSRTRTRSRSNSRTYNNSSSNNNRRSSTATRRRDDAADCHTSSTSTSASSSKKYTTKSNSSYTTTVGGNDANGKYDSRNVRQRTSTSPSLSAAHNSAISAVGAYYNLDTDEPFDKARIHREMEAKLRETLAKEGKVYPPPKPEPSHPVFANDGSFLEIFKKMQQQQQHRQPPTLLAQPLNTAIPAVNNTLPLPMVGTMLPNTTRHHVAAAVTATAIPTPTNHIATAMTTTIPAVSASINNTYTAIGMNNINATNNYPSTNSTIGNTTNGIAGNYNSAYIQAAAMGKSAPPPPLVGRRRGGKILKTGIVAKPKVQNEESADPKDFWSLYLAEVNKYKNTACETDGGKRPLVK